MDSLCDVTSSKRIYASELCSSGVPFYRSKEIIEKLRGEQISNPLYISESKFQDILRVSGAPREGDVLLTSRGTLGVPYLVRKSDRFHFADGNLTWFRNFKGIDSRFLCYFMSSSIGKSELGKCVIGSAQPAYTIQAIKKISVPVPPPEEQRRIASILSTYEDLIENNTRRIAILEELARSIYEEWFVRFRFPGHENVRMVESELGLVPEGWDLTTLGAVCAYINRGLAPKYDDKAPGVVINQKCIRDQRLSLSEARRQSKAVPKEKLVMLGDVLINSTGVGTLGRVAQVMESMDSCTVDTHVSIVRPSSDIDFDFFGLAMLSKQPHFEAQGVGSTGQTELSRGRIADTVILLPPKPLRDQFGKLVKPMRQLAVRLQAKNANLRTTRDLLLPKLISGELDVSALPEPEAAAA